MQKRREMPLLKEELVNLSVPVSGLMGEILMIQFQR
jgi:hypothetical protein